MTTVTALLLPRTWGARIQLLAAAVLVLLAFAGTASARVHAAVAGASAMTDVAVAERPAAAPVRGAAAGAVEPAAAPGAAEDAGFTLGDLAAGRVPQEVQDRFWQRQLEAILAAPCPATTAGGTTVTMFVGADQAWTARLEAAVAEHRAACAA